MRDAHGERLYPAEQVSKLRLVQRLLDLGCRPGKIMHLDHESLSQLASQRAANGAPAATALPAVQPCLAMVMSHQMQQLRQHLAQLQLQIGLERLVLDLLAPLTTQVGQAWASGALAVYEEHLYTEAVQSVLRNALYSVAQHRPAAAGSPRVLLTTVPQEQHGIGLLMAEALLSLQGAHCTSLGVQTPIPDIVSACASQRADIVALSFSSAISEKATLHSLAELRSRLPASVEIWAGGNRANLIRRAIAPIRVLDLDAIASAVARWRLGHAESAAG